MPPPPALRHERGSALTPQEWLARLLARPLTEPLGWDDYCLTMAEPTWKAVWAAIEASQAYDDGLELGLRLLRATGAHRDTLGSRAYASSRIRLYRSILAMLEKAGRWEAYLRIWDTILAQTGDLYVTVKGRSGDDNGAFAALIRHPSAGESVERGLYRAPPLKVEAHFLHAQLSRKAVVARRLAAEREAGPAPPSIPASGLPIEEIEQRLAEAAPSAA